jgi:hypothetical protein
VCLVFIILDLPVVPAMVPLPVETGVVCVVVPAVCAVVLSVLGAITYREVTLCLNVMP